MSVPHDDGQAPVVPISAAPSYSADGGGDVPDPVAELLAFLRRRVTGDYEVDEFGYDAELTDKVLLELLRPIYHHWFRVEALDLKNVPEEGGALVVANHAGTLPVDALMMQVALHDEAGRALRLLGADLVYKLPLFSHLSRKTGHTLACREDADRLLRRGELVGVFPEGFKGVGKPFSERYKLQRFGRGGFVASAIRAGVPIVPTAIVGSEEIYPKIGEVPFVARLLGLPYVPITPFFPLLGPLGLVPLPSKWLIEFGEPIRTDEFDPGAADDPMLVFNLTDRVREVIQQMLDQLRLRRGHAFPPFL
ncbi:lysophospholipid acyltransferase family protein [Nonomuraea sp. CA-218870]|uniref:lysophospholipid acyltransferase family protein n=1 Tax=Nonomuraea sp. CA-218870 TaxID=3239998 RepID=UPI003D91EB10